MRHLPMHNLQWSKPFGLSLRLQKSELNKRNLGKGYLRLPGRWRWLRIQASPWLIVALAPLMLLGLCGEAYHNYRARYLVAFTRLNLLGFYHFLEEITLDPTWLM